MNGSTKAGQGLTRTLAPGGGEGRRRWAKLAFAAALAALASHRPSPAAAQAPPEPAGYRMDDYRAATPIGLSGATVVDGTAAAALWREKRAIFIDVMPRPPRPANLAAGTLWLPAPRASIPGAVWLANVGFGALAEETDAYFRARLARLTGEDRTWPLVFFCERDCWMSWNAAKRALAYGYAAVHWYPDGTDGWRAAGLPLERLEPAP